MGLSSLSLEDIYSSRPAEASKLIGLAPFRAAELSLQQLDGLSPWGSGGLQVDANLAQFDDRRAAPSNRVGRKRQHERHSVLLSERLPVAQDAVVGRASIRP
jgi:hypothetical protein